MLGIDDNMPLMECIAELKKRNLYALLVADEIDQIYMSNDDHLQKRQDVVAELSELGSQKSGRVYTVACGSASVTPILISKNAVHYAAVLKEYSLVAHVTTLNGSKFSARRVTRGNKNEDATDLIIIGNAFKIDSKLMSLLYFYSGNNLRRLDEMVRTYFQRDEKAFEILCSLDSSWDSRAARTRDLFAPLLEAL